MSAAETSTPSNRLAAAVAVARGQAGAFRSEAEATRPGIAERSRKLVPIAERLVAIGRERRERLKFDVVPS